MALSGSTERAIMNKRFMLLAASCGLTIFALAVLPAFASAGEYTADCEFGAPSPCNATITGGISELINTSIEGVSCTAFSGATNVTSGSSTGTIELTFTGCRETITGFKFSCTSAGASSGQIKTGSMVYHNVNLEDISAAPGILITGVNMTFVCAGFAKKTVTGNVLGRYVIPECGSFRGSTTVTFGRTSPGDQTYKQVTTSGTIFDLISNNDSGGTYFTTSLTGTGTISYMSNWVKLTC